DGPLGDPRRVPILRDRKRTRNCRGLLSLILEILGNVRLEEIASLLLFRRQCALALLLISRELMDGGIELERARVGGLKIALHAQTDQDGNRHDDGNGAAYRYLHGATPTRERRPPTKYIGRSRCQSRGG